MLTSMQLYHLTAELSIVIQRTAGEAVFHTKKSPLQTGEGRGNCVYALSLVSSRYKFLYCHAEFSQDTFLSMSRWTISSQQ